MMSAAHALIEMPTECGSTTACNGQQYLDVLPTNPLAISLDEGSSSSADEIGNLERRRGHWGTSSSNVTHIYIKTAGRLRPNEETGKLRRAILGDTGIEEVLSTPHSPWQGEAPQERIQSKQKEHQSERDSGDNRDYLHVRNPFVSISLLSNNHSS